MTAILLSLADSFALILWIACLQFSLFGAVLILPGCLSRNGPAARHCLGLAALVAALLSPITAVCSLSLGWNWTPVPNLLLPNASSDTPLLANTSAEQTAPSQLRHFERLPDSSSDRSESPRQTHVSPTSGTLSPSPQGFDRPAIEPPASVPHLEPAPSSSKNTVPERVIRSDVAPRRVTAPNTAPPASTTETARSTTAFRDLLRAGLCLWLAGVLLGWARLLRVRKRLGRLLTSASAVRDEKPLEIARQAALETGLSAPPVLLVSQSVAIPFVTGVARPRVLLPSSLLGPQSETALRHVLIHEFCHLARHDLWTGLLQQVATTAFWPHPVVHAASRLVSESREELCDDRVLVTASARAYSRTLLALGEQAAGFVPLPISFLSRRATLARRISRLLDPRRDRSLRLRPMQRGGLALVFLAAAVLATGVSRVGAQDGNDANSQRDAADQVASAPELIGQLAARSALWLALPSNVETLEYDFHSGAEVTPIKAAKGESRRRSVWIGATLHGGLQELTRSPERFDVRMIRQPDGARITLVARPKDPTGNIVVEAGNGVEGSWRGYFSHGGRETRVVLDAERLVPLEERTGQTTFRYSEWKEVQAGRWVPLRVDVVGHQTHWRMRFAWLGDAVWLLTSSESISPEATVSLTRTANVRIDRRPFAPPETDADRASREAAKELLSMLDANRPWLDRGATTAGWKPPFEALSYTFHTVREDVREDCVLDREGQAAFEVAHDGQGKMKDAVGRRKIALDSTEHATARRGTPFARIYPRPDRPRDEPMALALKQYARIGCQFDLPLFRYRDRLASATVSIEEGTWNGKPCRVATVSNLGGGVYLGCGTMLAFTSRSYVHHVAPLREVIYIDPVRNIPLHETLTSSRDDRTFEIDFGDYVEVEPGQWAPRSIRIEAKDYFTCEYQFQLVGGTHWMLEEVVSWFKPEEKSRGVIEAVQIDAGRTLLDESLRQIESTRSLFSGVGEPGQSIDVATTPFVLGAPIAAGPYELKVTAESAWKIVVSASTKDGDAPGVIPIGFLDEAKRLLFAPSIVLEKSGGARRGTVALRSSDEWADVRQVLLPSAAAAARRRMRVVPVRWGEALPVNIPDSDAGETLKYSGEAGKRDAQTRVFRALAERTEQGTAKVTLDLVSIDGPQAFYLDLSAALLGRSGELLATGHHAGEIRVESEPVQQTVVLDLGRIPDAAEPACLAIGVARGDTYSAPMGSLWGQFFLDRSPFEVSALLAAPDESCRRLGLEELGKRETDESIEKEFFDVRTDERRVRNGPLSRKALIRPHVEGLVRILRDSAAPDVRASAARFLAYVEVDDADDELRRLLASDVPQVRQAAAVGLTFLGSGEHFELLGEALTRSVPDIQADRSAWHTFRRDEQDVLIALTRQASDGAIDLLGETLIGDLERAKPVKDEQGRVRLDGRMERAGWITKLLGHSANARAVVWLTAAARLVAERRELAENFDTAALAASMVRHKDQAREQIIAALTRGSDAAVWVRVLRESGDPAFVPAVATMLQRQDLSREGLHGAIQYLWNVGTPEAVSVLKAAYDRGNFKGQDRTWMTLCQALAAHGDGRGLADAYEILVALEHSGEPPTDERERRKWEGSRDDQREEAEEVFIRAPDEVVATFLVTKADVTAPEEQRVVLNRLWDLPEAPDAFRDDVEQWAAGDDAGVARAAARLLKRE